MNSGRHDERATASEFDEWAKRGKGESMARGHGDVTRQALDDVDFAEHHRALDVGCGVGWAVHLMRERGCGRAVGIDISAGMLRRHETRERTDFCVATARALPFGDATFDRILSVESLYYYLDVDEALGEIRRVTAPNGRFVCVVDLYADNPGSRGWADELDVPVHVISEVDYAERFRQAGFGDVHTKRLIDRRPLDDESTFEPSRWYPSYDTYRAYREAGSLLVDGSVSATQ